MIVNIDLMFFYELIMIFAGAGFFIGFILPLLLGGKPTRIFFTAKLFKKPTLLIWRSDKKMIATTPRYVGRQWIAKVAKKQYGEFEVHPDAITDFYGVPTAVADEGNYRVLPASIYKITEVARRLGYENIDDFIKDLKKQSKDNGGNPNIDFVYAEPPTLKIIKGDSQEALKLDGSAIRIADIEKMWKETESALHMMAVHNQLTDFELSMQRENKLVNYIGIGLMLMFVGFGVYFMLQGLKSMGWIHTIHLLVMSLV